MEFFKSTGAGSPAATGPRAERLSWSNCRPPALRTYQKYKPTRSSCELDGTLELPTRGVNVTPTRLPDESRNTRGNQHALEIRYRLIFRGLKVQSRPRIPGN